MKKIFLFTAASILLFTGCSNSKPTTTTVNSNTAVESSSNENNKDILDKDNISEHIINVNGKSLDKKPISLGSGEIGLPIKEIAEDLGYTVNTTEEGKLTIDKGILIEIELNNENKVIVDGREVNMEIKPVLVDDSIYISAPELSGMLDFEYEISNNQVNINEKAMN